MDRSPGILCVNDEMKFKKRDEVTDLMWGSVEKQNDIYLPTNDIDSIRLKKGDPISPIKCEYKTKQKSIAVLDAFRKRSIKY